MNSRQWLLCILVVGLAAGCGDDGGSDDRTVDAGSERDSGAPVPEDMGATPWIPDGFPEAVEAASLVFRASGPIFPLAGELRDDSLTISGFDETKSHFDAAIRDRLDDSLFDSDCSTFGAVSSGDIGANVTHADCSLVFGSELLDGEWLLNVQPRAGGRWAGRGSWQASGTERSAEWIMWVGGDCAPDDERCECIGEYCGTTARQWLMDWEESASRSWSLGGGVDVTDAGLHLHAPGGLQDDPRTFEADLREALVWQPGECLPSAGQLFIIDYADAGTNETIDFLPSTPTDGAIRVTDLDGVETVVSVFTPCP